MLFIAPYNHQVSKLQQALGPDAKVGSVDKFQGQEAPIVFLSMCSSDASESPRGINFLLDSKRLNVAISRARFISIVVASSILGSSSSSGVEEILLMNSFLALNQIEN